MLRLPAPEDDREDAAAAEGTASAGGSAHQHSSAGQSDRTTPHIPTAEQCLAAMAQLAGLVTMGLIKPSHANTVRALFSEILRHHTRAQSGDAQPVLDTEQLRARVQQDPSLIIQFAPLLTPEQLSDLLRDQDAGN